MKSSDQQNPSDGLWGVLPISLRTAGVIALTTAVTAGLLLFQTNVRSERPPDRDRAGVLGNGGTIAVPSPGASATPAPTQRPRSAATLTAPDDLSEGGDGPGGASGFPTFGTYVYSVEGTESVTALGSRDYPPEMQMTVRRPDESDASIGPLEDNELVFDLYFSEEHEERQVVAYKRNGIFFAYESDSITFGPSSRAGEATYDPQIVQIPAPLKEGGAREGSSTATSPAGDEVREEDWTVTVEGTEEIEVLGEDIATWVVLVERQSRPGSAEPMRRARKYWFDPERSIWVKWQESVSRPQGFGPGNFTYTTDFTATLDRIEPL